MNRSARPQPEWIISVARMWLLAPRRMRLAIVNGLVFRALQSLCLAGVFGAIAVWSLVLADGRSVSPAALLQTSFAAATLLLLQLWFAHLSVRCIWLTSFRLVGIMRRRLLSRLLERPLGFHLSRSKGEMAGVVTSDLALVENLLTDGLPRLVQSLALPLFVLLLIACLDGVTAGFAMLPILVALPVLLGSCRQLANLSTEKQQAQADATSKVLQWVEGMATVRSFDLLDRQATAFVAPLSDIHRISVRMVASLTAPLLGFGAIVMAGLSLIVAVAGYRHGSGDLSTGRLVAILVLSWPLCSSLLGLAQFMELAAAAQGALRRLGAIMEAEPSSRPSVLQPAGYAITFDNVDFHHSHGRRVLRGVSFHVPEGGLTAIVGPSGAGKSTVMNLLAGLFQPTEGRVLIGGVDMRDISSSTLDRLISVAFQDVQLFSGSIRDNITMGNPLAKPREIEQAAHAASAHAFISALPNGYDTHVGEGGLTLSGGERQRISLARALLKNAPIVLVDEGTASIDPPTARMIEDVLKRLSATRPVIIVTHRPATAALADRTVSIQQ